MCKKVADMFRITLGPDHPHSKMTETDTAYFFEYLYVSVRLKKSSVCIRVSCDHNL
jgi:hypothetical protein